MLQLLHEFCGFARGVAECKKPQTSAITGVYCTSMHPISDLLLWLQQESVDYYYKFMLQLQKRSICSYILHPH